MEDLIEINLTVFDPIIGVIYHCFHTKISFNHDAIVWQDSFQFVNTFGCLIDGLKY